jgi:hypothetical protein
VICDFVFLTNFFDCNYTIILIPVPTKNTFFLLMLIVTFSLQFVIFVAFVTVVILDIAHFGFVAEERKRIVTGTERDRHNETYLDYQYFYII